MSTVITVIFAGDVVRCYFLPFACHVCLSGNMIVPKYCIGFIEIEQTGFLYHKTMYWQFCQNWRNLMTSDKDITRDKMAKFLSETQCVCVRVIVYTHTHTHTHICVMCRTLLRRLADLGLRRRCQPSPMIDVWNAIHVELRGPGLYATWSVTLALVKCWCIYMSSCFSEKKY